MKQLHYLKSDTTYYELLTGIATRQKACGHQPIETGLAEDLYSQRGKPIGLLRGMTLNLHEHVRDGVTLRVAKVYTTLKVDGEKLSQTTNPYINSEIMPYVNQRKNGTYFCRPYNLHKLGWPGAYDKAVQDLLALGGIKVDQTSIPAVKLNTLLKHIVMDRNTPLKDIVGIYQLIADKLELPPLLASVLRNKAPQGRKVIVTFDHNDEMRFRKRHKEVVSYIHSFDKAVVQHKELIKLNRQASYKGLVHMGNNEFMQNVQAHSVKEYINKFKRDLA